MLAVADRFFKDIKKEYNRRFRYWQGSWHMQAFANVILYQSFITFLNHKKEGLTRVRLHAIRKFSLWLAIFSFLDMLPVLLFVIALNQMMNAIVEIGFYGAIWNLLVYTAYMIWVINYSKRLAKQDYNDLVKQAEVPKNKWGN